MISSRTSCARSGSSSTVSFLRSAGLSMVSRSFDMFASAPDVLVEGSPLAGRRRPAGSRIDDRARDRAQRLCSSTKRLEFLQTLPQKLTRAAFRGGDADYRRIRRFLHLLPVRGNLRDDGNIVGDLKCKPEEFAVPGDAPEILGRGAAENRSRARRGENQRAGFAHMNILDRGDVGLALLGLKIHCLAADHTRDSGGTC